ncbi:MAG: elongation factor G, partial [Clostridia bacterium]|nr:elongation factor G [Clostridia bacterium]
MKTYNAKDIFNIAVAGHSSSGKTSLIESMLFLAKQIDRLGKVDDGNTVCDFDVEEIKRHSSVCATVAPVEWKHKKINFIDTPGLFDFEGALAEGMRAADTALITVSGKSGISVGTKKAFYAAEKRNLAKVFFVNGLCDESSRFYRVFEELKAAFGPAVCPVVVPYIKDGKADCYVNILEYKAYKYENNKVVQVPIPDMGDRLEGLRTAVNEAVAETSDEMFEKYFSGETFTPEEIILGISSGVKSGKIYPVFCGDAHTTYGVEHLLNGLTWLTPSAYDRGGELAVDTDGSLHEILPSREAQAAVIVFKTLVDPFVGKLSFFKVVSGKIFADSTIFNMRTGNSEKLGKLFVMTGKKSKEVKELCAGDIGAVAKLQNVQTGDTLCAPSRKVILDPVEYPIPGLSVAIYPVTRGEEDKVAQGILRLADEDPTIVFVNNQETHEMVISTMGEQHTEVILSKLKNRFAVDAIVKTPKVAYRETIKSSVKTQGRHKKQTGGHGQFGDVWIEFSPSDAESLDFNETIVGGSVPKGYFPAVEKGLREAMQKGPLAGYPVVGLKATLYDGSYHPVDSSEMAFKMAAALAYRNGLPKANPVLLEPIGSLKAVVPDASLGDVMGEINKKRGR